MREHKKGPATYQSNTGETLTSILADILDSATARIVQAAANGDQLGWSKAVSQLEGLRRQLSESSGLFGRVKNEADRIAGTADSDDERIAGAARLRSVTMAVAARKGWIK